MFKLQYVDFSSIIDQLFLYLRTHVVVQEFNTAEVNYTSTTFRGGPTGPHMQDWSFPDLN